MQGDKAGMAKAYAAMDQARIGVVMQAFMYK